MHVVMFVRVRQSLSPWLATIPGLEKFLDRSLCQTNQLIFGVCIPVPEAKLYPLAHLRVVELWLSLILGVQVVVYLFGLRNYLPLVVSLVFLVLLDEANWITLGEKV